MIIDSHCHLNMKDFNNGLDQVIKDAKENNVKGMLTICTEVAEINEIKNISNSYENIWYSLGIHPNNVTNNLLEINEKVKENIKNDKFIGIGETGLDYFYKNSKIDLQKKSLINHIALARENDLPIIIHTRDADEDTINIIKDEYKKGKFRGLIHCFTASEKLAQEMLSIGFYISISGIITFKNAESIRNTVKSIPLNRLLVETDAPYLAPAPMRGKRNEPSFVSHTANYLANLLNVSFNELYDTTTNNFFNLFNKAERIK